MRGIMGLVGLLLALAIVGVVVKKQLAMTQAPVPALQSPTTGAREPGNVREQSQAVQQQYRQAVEAAMQTPRPRADEP